MKLFSFSTKQTEKNAAKKIINNFSVLYAVVFRPWFYTSFST